jgi:predicted GNAT family acetyltransferase
MKIIHNIAQSRFEYVHGPDLAVCEYRRSGTGWDLNHTYVPETMRGKGVAAALAKAALDHIKQHGGVVCPSCSYIAAFIEKNAQYSELLSGG